MTAGGQHIVRRAVIYSRCSTDEARQDTENQLRELRRYCEAYGWPFDEISEYHSAYKDGGQPKLQAVLERIRRQEFAALLVYSLDRLSRQAPSQTNRLLDELVEAHGCRFISRLEGIDSANELTWNVVRPIFAYFANLFSRNLSQKIRAGIHHQQERGTYRGGRPAKTVDAERLKALRLAHGGYGWRRLTAAYNEGLPTRQQVSTTLLRRVCRKLSFQPTPETAPN